MPLTVSKSIFVPDQSHHDNIEDRQHYKADAVRVGEAVELVDDEEAKNDKRNGIGPELVSQQTDDKEYLYEAVAQEVKCIEVLRGDGKILRQTQEMPGYIVIRIFDQFLLSKHIDKVRDGTRADESQYEASDALD